MGLKVNSNVLLGAFVLFAGIGQLLLVAGQIAWSVYVSWFVGIFGLLAGLALLVPLFKPKK